MLTPGEIAVGQWVVVYGVSENASKETQIDNPFIGMFIATAIKETPIPQLVLAVQLPYIVVCNTTTNPMITSIWDMREKTLMEVTPEFVIAYDRMGYENGLRLLAQNAAKHAGK